METAQNAKLLVVQNVTVQILRANELFVPVEDVSFEIDYGETLALVGESGSGKTLTALSIMGLLPMAAQRIRGEIYFESRRVTEKDDCTFRQLRGRHMVMLFQNAISALNPVFRIGHQFQDIMKAHHQQSSAAIKQEIYHLFDQVGLTDSERVYQSYPHQLSGGMAQRVMIAMALSCNPKLIIADEPTTALDVLTQLQILQLISSLQKEHHFSILLITHDLSVVSSLADSVIVMRQGKIVEANDTSTIFNCPTHHYTKALIDA